jgi:hypothetical protein
MAAKLIANSLPIFYSNFRHLLFSQFLIVFSTLSLLDLFFFTIILYNEEIKKKHENFIVLFLKLNLKIANIYLSDHCQSDKMNYA